MTLTPKRAKILSGLMVPLGLGLTCLFNWDWEWLARSGAVITAIAVLLLWEDIREVRETWNQRISQILDGPENSAAEIASEISPTNPTDMKAIRAAEEAKKDAREESRAIIERMFDPKKFQKTERWLLLVGTLLWGFGDVPNEFKGDAEIIHHRYEQVVDVFTTCPATSLPDKP